MDQSELLPAFYQCYYLKEKKPTDCFGISQQKNARPLEKTGIRLF
jgi:hypothetical protein